MRVINFMSVSLCWWWWGNKEFPPSPKIGWFLHFMNFIRFRNLFKYLLEHCHYFGIRYILRTTAEFCCLFFSQKNSMNSSNSVKHDVEHHLNVCCTTIFYYTWKCKPILSSLTVLKLALEMLTLVLELYFSKISMIKLALAAN